MDEDNTSIRAASESDKEDIILLLKEVNLPSEDISEHLNNFLVWSNGSIIGCVGLEVYKENALLRSTAVKPSYQGIGIGKKLTRAIIAYAKLLGVKNVYLLTTTAKDFFLKEGFEVINRDKVPESIKNTREFSFLCPDTAVCMFYNLKL